MKGDYTPAPDEKNIVSLYIKGYKGVILSQHNIEISSGENVLDLTTRLLDDNNIVYDASGGYFSMIDNQKQFDKGKASGWMYSINGEYPNLGAGTVKVKDRDIIEWLYTDNLGEDVGAIGADADVNNPTIDQALKIITDKATSETSIIKAIDDMVNNLDRKNKILDSKEIKDLLENSAKASEVLLKALDRVETKKLGVNLGNNAIKITKSLDQSLGNQKDTESIKMLSEISRKNMGIALAAASKTKDQDIINQIVDDILEISSKIELELSRINTNSNKNVEKSIGIRLFEGKNNSNIILPAELLEKSKTGNIDKIKTSSDSFSVEIAPDFLA